MGCLHLLLASEYMHSFSFFGHAFVRAHSTAVQACVSMRQCMHVRSWVQACPYSLFVLLLGYVHIDDTRGKESLWGGREKERAAQAMWQHL